MCNLTFQETLNNLFILFANFNKSSVQKNLTHRLNFNKNFIAFALALNSLLFHIRSGIEKSRQETTEHFTKSKAGVGRVCAIIFYKNDNERTTRVIVHPYTSLNGHVMYTQEAAFSVTR